MAPNMKSSGGYIELEIPEGQAINVRSSGDPAMIYPMSDDPEMANEDVSLHDSHEGPHNQLTAMVDGAVKLVNMLNFMKVELGDKNTFRSREVWRSAGAEFVATLLFVYIGCGSVVATGMLGPGLDSARLVAIAVAHGLAIALLAGATGAISGGHINPAVTVAFVVAGKENLIRASLYVGAQLSGAVVGAALLDLSTPGHLVGNLGSHALGHGVNAGQGLVMEVMLTFILVFTIFGVAVDRRGPGVIAPLPIGFAVLVDHLVGVPYTGASMNPARSFGPALVSGSFTSAHWIYWFGPCIGAALAAFVYKHIFLQAPIVPMMQDQKPEKKPTSN